MATAYFPEVGPSVVVLTVGGAERLVLVDGAFDLQLVGNGIDTLHCAIVSFDGSYRPGLRDEVILTRDGVALFGGIITAAPEAALDGPALPDIATQITASGFKVWATYRYVTITIPPGPLRAALAALVPFLGSHGVTLDPGQVVGPDLPEIVLVGSRLDAAFDQIVVLTGYAYTWTITPAKRLAFVAVGSVPAPFDLLDTGEPRQIGDVRVDRTLDDAFLNRVTVSIAGAGPASSAESFVLADGVSSGGFLVFTAKYPTSADINDLWPNVLYFDGVAQGPISWGIGDLVSNGGSFAWAWDYQARPARLVFDEAAGVPLRRDAIRRAGRAWRALTTERIDIAYRIAYPFEVSADNAADQAVYGVYEGTIAGPPAATLETATAYAVEAVTGRSAWQGRAEYVTPFGGLAAGMTQRIALAKRGIDVVVLISELRISVWSGAEPGSLLSSVTALVGGSLGGWRDVYRRWLGGGAGGVGGGVASTGGGGGVLAGGRGSYALAASRIEWVQVGTPGAWVEASGLAAVLDTTVRGGTSAVVRLRVRARMPGVAVTARLRNLDDGSIAGVSEPVTSTAFAAVAFAASLAVGEHPYLLELSASVANEDIQAVGYLE